jgi:hypothetical protein
MDFLWIGSSTLIFLLIPTLAVMLMRKRVKGWILIGTGGLIAGIAGLASQGFHVWALVDPAMVFGTVSGNPSMMILWQALAIGAAFGQLLFLVGLLLFALNLGSERRRITELEAILHDRDGDGLK